MIDFNIGNFNEINQNISVSVLIESNAFSDISNLSEPHISQLPIDSENDISEATERISLLKIDDGKSTLFFNNLNFAQAPDSARNTSTDFILGKFSDSIDLLTGQAVDAIQIVSSNPDSIDLLTGQAVDAIQIVSSNPDSIDLLTGQAVDAIQIVSSNPDSIDLLTGQAVDAIQIVSSNPDSIDLLTGQAVDAIQIVSSNPDSIDLLTGQAVDAIQIVSSNPDSIDLLTGQAVDFGEGISDSVYGSISTRLEDTSRNSQSYTSNQQSFAENIRLEIQKFSQKVRDFFGKDEETGGVFMD